MMQIDFISSFGARGMPALLVGDTWYELSENSRHIRMLTAKGSYDFRSVGRNSMLESAALQRGMRGLLRDLVRERVNERESLERIITVHMPKQFSRMADRYVEHQECQFTLPEVVMQASLIARVVKEEGMDGLMLAKNQVVGLQKGRDRHIVLQGVGGSAVPYRAVPLWSVTELFGRYVMMIEEARCDLKVFRAIKKDAAAASRACKRDFGLTVEKVSPMEYRVETTSAPFAVEQYGKQYLFDAVSTTYAIGVRGNTVVLQAAPVCSTPGYEHPFVELNGQRICFVANSEEHNRWQQHGFDLPHRMVYDGSNGEKIARVLAAPAFETLRCLRHAHARDAWAGYRRLSSFQHRTREEIPQGVRTYEN